MRLNRTKRASYVVLLLVALMASGFAIYNQFASDSNANSLATQVSQACTTNREWATAQGLNCQQAKDVQENNAPVAVQGPKGDKGDTGAQGDQGMQGIPGMQGVQGVQGVKGDKGDTGSQGNVGESGSNGADGTGTQGPKGDTGPAGPAGEQGPPGEPGSNGDTWKPVSSDFTTDNGRCAYRVTWENETTGKTTTTDAPANEAMCIAKG